MAAVLVVSPRTIGAQLPQRLTQPDSIPFELAAALAAAGGLGAEPQILVGAFPEWVASRIALPRGGRVLGSAFVGRQVVGIATASSTTADSLLMGLKRDLLARGWHNPPPPNYGGGFRSAAPPIAGDGSLTRIVVCSDDRQTLTTSAAPRRGSDVVITYRFAQVVGYNPCRPPEPPQGSMRPPYPTLFDPPGAGYSIMGSCTSDGVGFSTTGTAFRLPMTTEAILDRYAYQLADSGWKPEGTTPSIVGRMWTRLDSTGAPVLVSLFVTTGRDSTCHEVTMQVRTLKKS